MRFRTDAEKARERRYKATAAYQARRHELRNTPEAKEKARIYRQNYEKTAEAKALKRARKQTPEYKAKARVYMREYERKRFSDPVKRQQKYEAVRKWVSNPANKPQVREHARLKQARRRAQLTNVENTFTRADWRTLVSRSKHCHWCKKPFTKREPPTHDHVIPIARSGPNTLANSCCAHKKCNSRKGKGLFNPINGQGILL